MQKEIIACAFTGMYDILVALPTSTGKPLPIVISAMLRHYFRPDGTKRDPDEPKPFCLLLAPRTQLATILRVPKIFFQEKKVIKLENSQISKFKKDYRTSWYNHLRDSQPIIVIATVQLFLKGRFATGA